MKGKGWTPEDKTGGYPFNPNNDFVLEWIAEAGNTIRVRGFIIYVFSQQFIICR